MISKAKTVDAFLASVSAEERAVFEKLRASLNSAAPGSESMKYGMPTYVVGEVHIAAFNKQKNYLCLYINPEALDPHRAELEKLGLECGKSCLRFKKPGDLPFTLAEKLIRASAKLAAA